MDVKLLCIYLFWIGCILTSCSHNEHTENIPLLEMLPSSQTGIHFANQLREDEYLNIITYEYFYNGGGVAVGDINNDGLSDIFFTGNMVSNALYLNRKDRGYAPFQFEDVTETAGLSTQGQWANGAAMVDINQDGWLDIYVCMGGPYRDPIRRKNKLYINQKNGTFKDEAERYGLADTGYSVQAYFFDYDRDGWQDLYLLTNCFLEQGPNIIRLRIRDGTAENNDRLYRNNGNNPDGHPTFTDVTQKAGIVWEGNGLGAAICDFNLDQWPDIYVSNDYLSNDLLYINNGDGTYTNRVEDYLQHQSYSAMGNDVADFNNDGLADIFTLDMLPPDNYRQKLMFGATNYDRYRSELEAGYAPQFMRNTLQLNNGIGPDGHPIFSEISWLAGVSSTDWSWGGLFADLDNDGWKDLIITNGYPKDITNRDFATFKMQQYQGARSQQTFMAQLVHALEGVEGVLLPNFVFQNRGGSSDQELQFIDQSNTWGFSVPSYSHGMATADLDNDGDLDLVINNLNQEAFVYRNHAREQSGNGYLQVKFASSILPAQKVGAKLALFHEGIVQYQEYSPYRGYLSSVEPTIHFGVGNSEHLDSLVVWWPDGTQQVEKVMMPNQELTLSRNLVAPSKTIVNPTVSVQLEGVPPDLQEPWFKDITSASSFVYQHQEKDYVDFKVQPLLPHKFSQAGPGIAAGDINGDGNEDVVIGGSFQQKTMIYWQDEKSIFHSQPLAEDPGIEEILGVLLFDADNDQDLDLYMVSGGYEFPQASEWYQDHLYLNDGRGNFQMAADALPEITSSGSCVKAADYDRDGDLDLFVGGFVVPGQYPEPPQSYVLKNQEGKFTDVTEQESEKLMRAGMVKDALWTDFTGDGWMDLIIVGEWMPLLFYENQEGKLIDVTQTTGLTTTEGWWNSVVGGDFDNDGDTDYVVGNQGWNSRYRPSPQRPLQIHARDFDQNGSMDPVMTYSMQGKAYPMHPREDMIQQMSFIKGKFPRYADYAQATLTDIFSPEELQEALTLQAVNFSNVYIENLGEGQFSMQPLPARAQFSPLFGMVVKDVDEDGNLDLLFCGNSYATEVLSGRQDASIGGILMGDGQGNFNFIAPQESGFVVDGDAKGMISTLNTRGEELIIATQNNGPVKIFTSGHTVVVKAESDDAWAEIHLVNGKIRRQELYQGHTYLSGSSRYLTVTPDVSQIIIHKYSGVNRQITLPDPRRDNGI